MKQESLRDLPPIEPLTQSLAKKFAIPKQLIAFFVKNQVANWRIRLLTDASATRSEIETDIATSLAAFVASRLQPVINGTGVIIHTNLGRSPLGYRAMQALAEITTGYSNLEFNIPEGTRGPRAAYLESSLAALLRSEGATVVNNCAAALVLILHHLLSPEKKEVIVSRGELVEIGGGFRISEILETSGATLIEVGATNKTHLDDYKKAITAQTALILKVHRSNFYIEGFTTEPTTREIAELSQAHNLPLVKDLGSGAIMATDQLAPIEHEPTPQEALQSGVDLITFSGDKLLGGPQSGVIAGKADLIAGLKKEPFFRAVRCDKLILTVLQEVITDYLNAQDDPTTTDIPALNMLATPLSSLQKRGEMLLAKLEGNSLAATFALVESTARTGGGTMPKSQIPSIALQIIPSQQSLTAFSKSLRLNSPAIVGYTAENAFHLNLCTIFPNQDEEVERALIHVLSPPRSSRSIPG